MELERHDLGWTLVLTPRNVEEIWRSLVILNERGECGRRNVLRKLTEDRVEFITIAIDLDAERE